MPEPVFIKYKDIRISDARLAIIEQANEIVLEYQADNLQLSLRQLYYQFVARGLIQNKDTEYKRLGDIIGDGRLAGLVDWTSLEDRGRELKSIGHFTSPADIMSTAVRAYRKDMWVNQPYRPEVWIEKDALLGVIETVCQQWDVPYFSCRGYNSLTEMWKASQRIRRHIRADQKPIIFHLGDHDPSGIDMSRDIRDRLEMFFADTEFERLALNMDQVQQYGPPPNPAKITDSRAFGYIKIHGNQSWELDALEPRVLAQRITDSIDGIRDDTAWDEKVAEVAREQRRIELASERWNEVDEFLGEEEEEV